MSADDVLDVELARLVGMIRGLKKDAALLAADRDAWEALARRLHRQGQDRHGRIRISHSGKMGGSVMSLIQRAYRHQGIIPCFVGWQLRALQRGKRMQRTDKILGRYPTIK